MDAFDRDLGEVRADIRNIKENHLAHIERDLSTIVTDVDWIKRFFWLLAGAAVSSLVANIVSLSLSFTPQ